MLLFQATATSLTWMFTGTLALVAVLVLVWPVLSNPTEVGGVTEFMVLLLPTTDWVFDCVVVITCVAVDAWPDPITAAAAGAAAALTATGFQTIGFHIGIVLTVLTSQHCVTTQHATVGQQHVVGQQQLQHVEVVQLVH